RCHIQPHATKACRNHCFMHCESFKNFQTCATTNKERSNRYLCLCQVWTHIWNRARNSDTRKFRQIQHFPQWVLANDLPRCRRYLSSNKGPTSLGKYEGCLNIGVVLYRASEDDTSCHFLKGIIA